MKTGETWRHNESQDLVKIVSILSCEEGKLKFENEFMFGFIIDIGKKESGILKDNIIEYKRLDKEKCDKNNIKQIKFMTRFSFYKNFTKEN